MNDVRNITFSLRSRLKPLSRKCFVLVAVMIGFANSGTSAVAGSCGHYLFRNGKPVHSHEIAIEHQMGSEIVTQDLLSTTPTPSKPQPCRGPGCRSGSIPLAPSPAPFQMHAQTELAVLFEQLSALRSTFGLGGLPSSERLPNPCVDEIFRPPANV
ncbi:MAG: hypothetical protein ACK58L_01620 [Planctomycetota bacterium]